MQIENIILMEHLAVFQPFMTIIRVNIQFLHKDKVTFGYEIS